MVQNDDKVMMALIGPGNKDLGIYKIGRGVLNAVGTDVDTSDVIQYIQQHGELVDSDMARMSCSVAYDDTSLSSSFDTYELRTLLELTDNLDNEYNYRRLDITASAKEKGWY